MKIITPGKRWRGTCKECGCQVEVTKKETSSELVTGTCGGVRVGRKYVYFVDCPECGYRLYVEEVPPPKTHEEAKKEWDPRKPSAWLGLPERPEPEVEPVTFEQLKPGGIGFLVRTLNPQAREIANSFPGAHRGKGGEELVKRRHVVALCKACQAAGIPAEIKLKKKWTGFPQPATPEELKALEATPTQSPPQANAAAPNSPEGMVS
jgi:hypothetical protein